MRFLGLQNFQNARHGDYSDVTITAADLIMYGDATDSNHTKRDTVQGVLDLAVGASGLHLIGTDSADDSADLTITGLTSTYDTYFFAGENLFPANNESIPWLRLGDSSGIDEDASDYDWGNHDEGFGTGSTEGTSITAPIYGYDIEDAQIEMTGATNEVGTGTGEGCHFSGYLHGAQGNSYPTVHGLIEWHGHAGSPNHIRAGRFAGSRFSNITTTSIRFLFHTGNITSGRFTVWGLAHA